ncbi:hypothetical protein [Staphylococcus equorum]|uniref:Uncharacterized protein n=1 Tax=Staphylococcus equorum TaxID=246432 RepID=A0AAP7IFZ2_9STAP|nr:hypothetical protein [Staphylococcus equorum]OEK58827.1 hypothetical protein ASS94_01350 [Staphylococcus equorum]
MKKDSYVLRNEQGGIVFHREGKGAFTTQIYPLLVDELIDKLKIDSVKYLDELIELKEKKHDINTVIHTSEILGYYVEEMDYEEINKIRYGIGIQ